MSHALLFFNTISICYKRQSHLVPSVPSNSACLIVAEMEKMEGFETPEKIFTWLSIYPAAKGTSRLEKTAHFTFGFTVFLANFCAALAHLGYLCKYISIDLKGSVFAFMGVASFGCLTYIIITVFRLRLQICSIKLAGHLQKP